MKKRKGFALVEVVAGLILLTGYITFNTAIYYGAYTNVREVQQYTIATNLLIKTAEQVKAQEYNEVVGWADTYTVGSYSFDVESDVVVQQYNSLDYKKATVTISWNENDSLSVDILKYEEPVWVPVE